MSETEHRVGKLTPVEINGTIEETAEAILKADGVEPKEYYDTFLDQLEDVGYRQYVITDGKIYKVDMAEIDPYNDIFNATHNEDGTIDFEVKYYNGGCSFNEAIEEAIKAG